MSVEEIRRNTVARFSDNAFVDRPTPEQQAIADAMKKAADEGDFRPGIALGIFSADAQDKWEAMVAAGEAEPRSKRS